MKSAPVSMSGKIPQTTQTSTKKAVKTAAAATIATGAALYMAKTGKLNPKEGGNKAVEGLKAAIKKPADFVLEKGNALKSKIITASKGNPKVSAVTDKVGAFKEAHIDPVVSKVAGVVDTLKDKAESVINRDKFSVNQDTLDTFNNFVKK